MIRPNSPTGKAILAAIRDGDDAHAGAEEPIARGLAGLAPDPARRLLDVGCGRGGTAGWARRRGLGAVTGLAADDRGTRRRVESGRIGRALLVARASGQRGHG